MIQQVFCASCGKGGSLDVSITARPPIEPCVTCHRFEDRHDDWHSCNVTCLAAWLVTKDVFILGFPCRWCQETGFMCGFEVNGPCDICKGAKRLLAPTAIPDPFDGIEFPPNMGFGGPIK